MSELYNEELEPQENLDEQLAPSEKEDDSTSEDVADTRAEEVETLKAKLNEVTRDKNGLIKKVNALTRSSNPTSQAPVAPAESERLDKLELQMIDSKLTSEQKQEILLIKNAKGLADVSEAYNLPMVQSWLKESRTDRETDDKIRKATPKAQRSMTSQPQDKKTSGIKYNKDWVQEIPSDNTRAIAQMLEESILADD